MTITLDMTVVAVLALIAGVASFFAPRFLGILVGAGLIAFGVLELFPGITKVDIRKSLDAIQLSDFQARNEVALQTSGSRNPHNQR